MSNGNPFCAVRKALLSIEQSSRLKAKNSAEIFMQVMYGSVSLEVQRERLAHECQCSRCLSVEAA